ncbi:transposase [Bradyrhizobium sp. AZCC 1620]|uniref:transposase n=1 Tax=unclassified Bradyrhizobium TaxID=2631580 RepID=UPI003FA5D0CF
MICQRLNKREQGCGSIRSGATAAADDAEKRRMVEESLGPGASVIEVARRHDVHPHLLTGGGGREQAPSGPHRHCGGRTRCKLRQSQLRRSCRPGRLMLELVGRSRSRLQTECSFGSQAQSIPRLRGRRWLRCQVDGPDDPVADRGAGVACHGPYRYGGKASRARHYWCKRYYDGIR